ncbi:hypothetical protein [Algoriphagus sp. A40]|uniref:hypothetical protein n=1 Tax=Algoriphagus sp. A40 TaxID=1945863 RepID=UPI00143ADFA0|nr:hypothetical protein [Algoriphagus sp. A40]
MMLLDLVKFQLKGYLGFIIQMIVLSVTGVKTGFAMLPGIVESLIILVAQFIGAEFAVDGLLIEFGFLPNQWALGQLVLLGRKSRDNICHCI